MGAGGFELGWLAVPLSGLTDLAGASVPAAGSVAVLAVEAASFPAGAVAGYGWVSAGAALGSSTGGSTGNLVH